MHDQYKLPMIFSFLTTTSISIFLRLIGKFYITCRFMPVHKRDNGWVFIGSTMSRVACHVFSQGEGFTCNRKARTFSEKVKKMARYR